MHSQTSFCSKTADTTAATLAESARRAASRSMDPAVLQSVAELNAEIYGRAAGIAGHNSHRSLSPGEVPPWRKSLDALASGNTAAVVTGQQVGLFLGPLFTLYKIATAVKTAREIERDSGIRAVPVFWLQTEDHDFAEIGGARLVARSGEPLLLALSEAANESRVSVEYRTLGEEIEALVERLAAEFAALPAAGDIIAALKRAYRPEASPAEAFAELLAHFVADYGVLFFNPRAKPVSAALQPVFHRALSQCETIEAQLVAETARLGERGIETVHIRKDSPLFFYHPEGASGPRFRLQRRGTAYQLAGGSQEIDVPQLFAEIENHPEKFSSSALLRTVAQQALLPVAVYVGGPAEVDYWQQAAVLFDAFEVPAPVVLPRAHFMLVDAKAEKWLQALGLEPGQLVLPERELEELVAKQQADGLPGAAELEEKVLASVGAAIEELRTPFAATDTTLIAALENSRAKVDYHVKTLISRYERARLAKNKTALERLAKLKSALAPDRQPQERAISSLSYLLRFGKPLFARIVAETEPIARGIKTIYLGDGYGSD